jgi:hypothetical protein
VKNVCYIPVNVGGLTNIGDISSVLCAWYVDSVTKSCSNTRRRYQEKMFRTTQLIVFRGIKIPGRPVLIKTLH